MFRRILVANRGEVAARVISTCERLGVETVAVCSDADADLSYLQRATVIAPIGPPRAYLDADALLDAAQTHRCSAVHPGWGFLAENPIFATRCEAARLTFIGPRPRALRDMADKARARATMQALGLPPIPGSPVLETPAAARAAAAELGLPVLLKALAGGGGRGMRAVTDLADIDAAFAEATAESAGAFGDGTLYMEKLITAGRHIEFQVLGDGERIVVLGARECSVQRRHQKLLEETPPPGLAPAAVAATAARIRVVLETLGYRGAGTVEMLQDDAGALWFMEMNTRLQVEHTVTEAVTGIDLVEWQLRVACNERIGDRLDALSASGHAVECRINAEDVSAGFRPQPGVVRQVTWPDGVRVDTHLSAGDRISPHYDSMFAKLIASGPDRPTALQRMRDALDALNVSGVPTTAALHRWILDQPAMIAGDYDTRWLERHLPRFESSPAEAASGATR